MQLQLQCESEVTRGDVSEERARLRKEREGWEAERRAQEVLATQRRGEAVRETYRRREDDAIRARAAADAYHARTLLEQFSQVPPVGAVAAVEHEDVDVSSRQQPRHRSRLLMPRLMPRLLTISWWWCCWQCGCFDAHSRSRGRPRPVAQLEACQT